jgi:hypothetical protein
MGANERGGKGWTTNVLISWRERRPPTAIKAATNFVLAIGYFRSHNVGMPQARKDVTFAPVEWTILPEWYVLATFPDGKELRISGAFKSRANALTWIEGGSAKWLKEHNERQRKRG